MTGPDAVPAEDLRRAREVAVVVASEAADLALAHQLRGVRTEEKAAGDLVSVADREVEELIVTRLAEAFPDDAVVGEEGTGHGWPPAQGRRRWYVDPIDGTTNYLRGLPAWGVSVGLSGPDDELLVGAVVMPRTGEVFSAATGQGATCNGVPLRSSSVGSLSRTLVCHAHSWRSAAEWGSLEQLRAGYVAVASRALGTRMQGCAVADLTAIARGTVDAMWAGGMSAWDVAAGLVIAREAGARITDVDGHDVDRIRTAFLASSHPVHAELRALILDPPSS